MLHVNYNLVKKLMLKNVPERFTLKEKVSGKAATASKGGSGQGQQDVGYPSCPQGGH